MDHLTSEDADRLREYLDRCAIQVVDALGAGADGSVWSTSRRTAPMLHCHLRRYRQERDVYLRPKQKRRYRLAGFSIPILLSYDDHARVLERGPETRFAGRRP